LTDHRIGLTLHSLNQILDGKLDPVVGALAEDEKVRLLTAL
jgi:peptide chain release factor 1